MARIVFGNHPFEVRKDQPMCIRKEQVGYFTYPDFDIDTSDLNSLYISTPEVTMGYYELAPGSMFSPPDHHPGDECYFIVEGELTEVNVFAGEAVRLQKDEVLLIPMEGAHGGYNFGQKRMKAVFALAPNMVSGQNFPTDLRGKWRVLKDDGGDYQKYPSLEVPRIQGNIDRIGCWPVDGESLRQEPKHLRHIREEDKLLIINGMDNPYLMKFAVSNDLIHFGELIMPSGGKGCRVSEPESHEGCTCIFVLEGALSFMIMETRETFKVEKDELMYIPGGMEYMMMNYWESYARAVFCIAGGL